RPPPETGFRHFRLVAVEHEPLLEGELAIPGPDPRAKTVVGRRQDPRVDAEGAGEALGDRRPRLAAVERLAPSEVEAEVAVAELEPGLGAELGRRLAGTPGLALPPPAALEVGLAAERVKDRVDVR